MLDLHRIGVDAIGVLIAVAVALLLDIARMRRRRAEAAELLRERREFERLYGVGKGVG